MEPPVHTVVPAVPPLHGHLELYGHGEGAVVHLQNVLNNEVENDRRRMARNFTWRKAAPFVVARGEEMEKKGTMRSS